MKVSIIIVANKEERYIGGAVLQHMTGEKDVLAKRIQKVIDNWHADTELVVCEQKETFMPFATCCVFYNQIIKILKPKETFAW